ncbi:MAG: hypothetical protein ACI4MS_06475 [Candidatus Coproplasma sp.]
MKKKFEAPKLEIILIEADVVTTSQFNTNGIYDVKNIWDALNV